MNLTIPQDQTLTMSSLDFLNNIINPAREMFGEKPVANDKFLKKVIDEIGFEESEKKSFTQNGHFKPTSYFDLDYDQLMLVGMRESKGVRRSVLNKLKELAAPKEDPVVLLAKKVLQQDEEIKQLEKTKAQINDKRTATIMGKLGHATKKIKKLEEQLQDVGSYLSVVGAKLPQRVDTPLKDNVQSWRLLKQLSVDMQLEPKRVKDERYGEVLAYHVDVIEKFKAKYC